MEKQALREKMLKARSEMDRADFERLSGVIVDKLLTLDWVLGAQCVMAYYSHKNEPDLMGLIHRCLGMGKRAALPHIAGKGEMIAVGFDGDSVMKSNIYGIPEPVLTNDTEIETPDVVIVPGVAFDLRLNRLGFGGGYYDRYLKETGAKRIGVCFDFQIVDEIKTGPFDVPMDMIVTEKRVIGGPL